MKAAALQFDVRRDDVPANLARVEEALRAAAADGCELVVLPEMWPTSFPGPDTDLPRAVEAGERAVARAAELAGELGLMIAGSSYGTRESWEDGHEGEPVTNRFQLFDGTLRLSAYDKVHLHSPTAERESFVPGREPPTTVASRLGRIAGLVCYDLRFPEITRIPFRDEVELVCVSAQWPSARAMHFEILVRALAITDQCFVVAANRTGRDEIGRRRMVLDFPGNSLIVDPHGEVLAAGEGREGLIAAEFDLSLARELRTRVPVAKDVRPDLYADWDCARAGAHPEGF